MDRSALQAALVGHSIGNTDLKKPVNYVMMGDGVWEIRKTQMGNIIRRMAEARIPGLPCSLKEGIELAVPKIPFALLGQAVSFFRAVYRQHRAEAILRIVWNTKTKKHEMVCPHQRVSGGRVDFGRDPLPPHQVLMADIHSHHSMSAYFSPTDDGDEQADLVYMVVGKIDRIMPELAIRLRASGQDVSMKESDILEPSEISMDAPFPPQWLEKVQKYKPVTRSFRPRMTEDQMELAQMMYSRKDLIEMGVIDEEDDLSFFDGGTRADSDEDEEDHSDDGWPDTWRMP